jgi:trimeric autotransporter adhesin
MGDGPVSVALGDLDGDGDLDVVTANQSSNNISFRRNNGAGSFGISIFSFPTNIAVGTQPRAVALLDAEEDGDLDIAVANRDSNTVLVLGNNGNATFFTSDLIAVATNPISLLAADLDNDGGTDLATLNQTSSDAGVLRGRLDGSFESPELFGVGAFPVFVTAGDLNGDGVLDLIFGRSLATQISVLLSTP